MNNINCKSCNFWREIGPMSPEGEDSSDFLCLVGECALINAATTEDFSCENYVGKIED